MLTLPRAALTGTAATLLLSLTGLPAGVFAQGVSAQSKAKIQPNSVLFPAPSQDPATRSFTVPLAQLIGKNDELTLKGPSPEVAFGLPMPARIEPVAVTLHLAGVASKSLLESSQLVVKVNGRVVEQIGLRDDNASFKKVITIPAGSLQEGHNEIRMVGAQRSHPAQTTCAADVAPELWTQIDMAQSSVVIQARAKPVPLRLDAMDTLFDKAMLEARPVLPVFTVANPDANEMKALGMTAQGLGRRFGDTPLAIMHARLPVDPTQLRGAMPAQAHGAVVLGTFDQVSPYLEGLSLPDKPGPIIALRPVAGDATRFVLVLAAEKASDLAAAATVLAIPGMPWPDEPWLEVNRLEMPVNEAAQRIIEAPADPTAAFPLRALNYRTTTATGKHAPETALKIWNNNWHGRLLVQVHLSYASGMSAQSALNVMTNGVLHGSIPLNNPAGGNYFNYAVTVPAGSLKLGWNTLQFQPVLLPDGTGEGCKLQTSESLAVTLYDDTMVQKYEGVSSKQPDLALLSGLGRAFINSKTPTATAVHLTDNESTTLGAGLTLMAKLAQVQQGPLQAAWFGVGEGPSSHNHIWVGAAKALPAEVRNSISVEHSPKVAVKLPLIESSLVSRPDSNSWLASLKDHLGYSEEKPPVYTNANLDVATSMGNKTYAYTQRANDITTTVFTANNTAALAAGIHSITSPRQWGQLRGSFASWTPGVVSVTAVAAEEAPFQAYGLRGGLAMLVSRYPWVALVALSLAIVLLVPITARILRNYRKRIHGPHQQ